MRATYEDPLWATEVEISETQVVKMESSDAAPGDNVTLFSNLHETVKSVGHVCHVTHAGHMF